MKIKEIKIAKFSLPLKKAFRTSKLVIQKREGLIIRVTNEKNNYHYGEISPLPGFSKESQRQVIAEIDELKKHCIGLASEDVSELIKDYMPSVRFGIEQAISSNMNLLNDKISVNAVVGISSTADTIGNIKKAVDDGFRTIKLKIGKNNFPAELALLRNIESIFGSSIQLRLDVNGVWLYEDAVGYLEELATLPIEYIEQPVSSITDILLLNKKTTIPLAVDECINCLDDAAGIIKNSDINILVIKPMMLGFNNTISIINLAKVYDKKIIISSLFESVCGRSALIYLAGLVEHNLAHGLSTSGYFQYEYDADKLPVNNGQIDLINKKYPIPIDYSSLEFK